MARYMRWLGEARGRRFDSYDDLWAWSVDDLEGFWGSVWEHLGVIAHRPYARVLERSLSGNRVEGARWFTGAELNYAEHALRRRDDHPAVVFTNEAGASATLTYAELAQRTAEAAAGLRRIGVGKGDAVVGYLPNVPEAVVAALAAASIGAVWSCCPPEFGAPSVIDRFAQLEPKVLLGVDGYTYAGRRFDATAGLREV
ncbi:MAG: AMP-binding protein, partial [Chloroflexi bacterium]|nr:AMP-binding protein [Chloroflexota bacterium]